MLELNLEVVQVESNPQLVQIVPPNEVVVLISFELSLGEMRGMMNLCIPYNSIERISGKVYQETGRLSDWLNLLGELRQEHKAKRRLLEVLDGLSGKKITD